LAGLFFGAAFMTKQVALFSLLGPGIFAAWILCSRHRSARALGSPLLLGAAGACSAVAPLCAWLAVKGAFGHFLEAAFGFNVSYVGSPFGAWKWEQMLGVISERFLVTNGLLWAAAVACLVLVVFDRRTRGNSSLFLVIIWLLGSLFGVALGPKTFPHYFLQVLPPLAVAAALVVAWIAAQTAARRELLRALALGPAVLVLIPLATERIAAAGKPAEERSFELYGYYGAPPFVAAAEVGKYLEKTTKPDDRILVVGSEPEILFHARRRSATRFTIFYPLTGTFAGSDAMLAELFGEIEKNRPAKIVLAREGVFFVSGRESPEEMMLIQARVAGIFDFVQRFVAAGYVEEDLVFGDDAGRVLWKSRNGAPPGLPPLFHVYTLRE
jgi:4-amino-4-deoxy-L-arabinose transferase-like glycosyltransferase